MKDIKELLQEVKDSCSNTSCEECIFATGVYSEVQKGYYYFCELKKKPREWDLTREEQVLVKEGKPAIEKEAKKKTKRVVKNKK